MKRVLLILIALTIGVICLAQQKQSRVTLKSGTVITGTIVEINPTSHIILNVAGFETRFEMSDIASIEEASTITTTNEEILVTNPSNKVIYPPVYKVEVGPYQLEMILVKGGKFKMGYDGRGSQDLRSEPVHDVILSDFYINRVPLKKDLVDYLKSGVEEQDTKGRSYSAKSWKDANKIAKLLATATGLPFRMITESQFEYVAVIDNNPLFEVEKYEVNYCYDWFDVYLDTGRAAVDPIGPGKGRSHVIRAFSASGSNIYGRSNEYDAKPAHSIRVTFPASAIVSCIEKE